MGPYKRNWFVGGTVLLALITLAFLIIMFGGSLGSFFAGEKIHVTFRSPRGDGLSDGAAVRYLGQPVGTVKQVRLMLDQSPNYVLVDAELDREKAAHIRGDTTAAIRVTSALGSAAIIELLMPTTPDTGVRIKERQEIKTEYIGLDILPSEFADLAGELKVAVKGFNQKDVVGDLKVAVNNFNAQVTKAGQVMDSVNAVLGTQETQTDLKTAIASARKAVENFEKISADLKALPPRIDATVTDVQGGVADARKTIALAQERIASVTDQLNHNLDKIAGILEDARSISDKINKGDGTLGRLLNDPKLYDTIVTATQVINETVKDIQRLVRGIEEEGFPINMK